MRDLRNRRERRDGFFKKHEDIVKEINKIRGIQGNKEIDKRKKELFNLKLEVEKSISKISGN